MLLQLNNSVSCTRELRRNSKVESVKNSVGDHDKRKRNENFMYAFTGY